MKTNSFQTNSEEPTSLVAKENPRCATPFIDSLRFSSTPDLYINPIPAYLRREKIAKKRDDQVD